MTFVDKWFSMKRVAEKKEVLMKYTNIKKAVFIARPNRFIAEIEIDGKRVEAHVKNTGRCKELLTEKATVLVEECDVKNRRTKYDLIAVYKGERLINMDSQVPNKVFNEWLIRSHLFEKITLIKPESKYRNSRFDFFVQADGRDIFIEVKGVTLEDEGVVRFPDAPTLRGVKHIEELCECIKEGYEAYLVFIIQMKGVKYFAPNQKTHKEFGDALLKAKAAGVHILALDCFVMEDYIEAADMVEVRLQELEY